MTTIAPGSGHQPTRTGLEAIAGSNGNDALTVLRPDDVITGDAVALDLVPATFAARAMAFLVDAIIIYGALLAATILAVNFAQGVDLAAGAAMSLLVTVGVLVVWPVTFETLSHGRSPGKMALGLRVVRDDAGPIRMRHAMIRGLLGVVELWGTSGAVALFASMLSRQGKRIGDALAGTYVITERPPKRRLVAAQMPPHLQGWAVNADFGRVPDQLALAAREVLGRANSMDPRAVETLAAQIAAALSQHVSPPPPPGTPPTAFIAAVLAERRRRDLERLAAERARRDARASSLHDLPFT